MKVYAINGSPRITWNTAQLCRAFLEGVKSGQSNDYSKYRVSGYNVEEKIWNHEQVFSKDFTEISIFHHRT